MWAACAVAALSACSDWTDTESIKLVEKKQKQIEKANQKLIDSKNKS